MAHDRMFSGSNRKKGQKGLCLRDITSRLRAIDLLCSSFLLVGQYIAVLLLLVTLLLLLLIYIC